MGGEGKSFYVGSDVAKSIYLEKERGNKMRIHNFLSSDTAFFGAGLSRNSRQQKVENLMNQKQSLLERKNELLSQTSESEKGKKLIQNILDTYEEQIKSLDQQISKEMMSQPEKKEEKPKTKQDLEREKITDLVTLSSTFTKTKAVRAAQTQVEGEARVLESEIKTDKGRLGDSEGIAKKEERLVQLKQRATKIASEAGAIAKEVIEEAKKEEESTEQSDFPERK